MDVSVEAGHSVASWCGGIRLEVYPLMGRPGVRAIGEIGLDTRTAWREVLARLVRSSADRLHVDPSRVTFIDVAGVTDLAVAARSLSGGGGLWFTDRRRSWRAYPQSAGPSWVGSR
ncbi:STAS domain-containing protein [Streptomyces sp. NPDC004592]